MGEVGRDGGRPLGLGLALAARAGGDVGTDPRLIFAGVGVAAFVGELAVAVRGEMVDVLEMAGEGGGLVFITGSEDSELQGYDTN